MISIVIGGAWPYANGSLHIGHIAALLPGDVLARYFRAAGHEVFYVSGSDCHGTPITIRARQEGTTPAVICERYHQEFCEVFKQLGFSYDLYTKTSNKKHKAFVTAFHRKLYSGSYVEERTVKQAFCPACSKVLTDRFILGTCPSCGAKARGDQCDACGELLDVDTLLDARCSVCSTSVTFRETTQLYLLISKLKKELSEYLNEHPYWRKNAIAFTKRYIDEGLRDRAITRDLDWGIDVPLSGYEDKRIYIWAENVLGYLSAVSVLCDERGLSLSDVFGADSRHYYVHGKDNIPFHTIILPALLLAHGEHLRLPDEIISCEYMTLEGRKISTSQNWAVWAKDLADRFHPDAIRYFFISNGPEKRDTDFSWREFKKQNNTELVGAWGNFVNRTLAFAVKYFDCEVPEIEPTEDARALILSLFESAGRKIEKGAFREALDEVFAAIRYGNTYYDSCQPWKTRKDNPSDCRYSIGVCIYLIANIAALVNPFLPFSSAIIAKWLNLPLDWKEQKVSVRSIPSDITVLFTRIDQE